MSRLSGASEMEYFKTIVRSKKQLAPDVWHFVFELTFPEAVEFTAGQYLIMIIGEQKRLYSIASPESRKDSFELVVKLLPQGVGSDYLRSLEIEDRAYFQGPAGSFTLKSLDRPKIFLAAGTGIAPIRSQILTYLENQGKAELFLFWGLPRRDTIYFFDELKQLAQKYPNFNFLICLSQENSFLGLDVDLFKRGRIDKGFLDFVKERKLKPEQLNGFEYYLCGAKEIVESLNNFLQELGINKENILFDKY